MRNKNFMVIVILATVLALLMNFPLDNSILLTVRNILGLFFIMYFPGYLLIALLFDKKFKTLETLEVIVLSIGLSISLTILTSMLLHFIRKDITAVNILNLVLIISFILGLVNFFKNKSKRKFQIKDKNFLFLMILSLVALAFMIYISATSPSTEEFVEIYWKISKIENLTDAAQINCNIDNCSISGIPKIGDMDLAGEKYKAIIMDIEGAFVYEHFCVDINRNNIYCDNLEGPFKYNDTFLINGYGFNVIDVDEDNIIVVNYPKEVSISDFRIGFVAKSYYKRSIDLNLNLFIDEILRDSKTITLYPEQETLEYFNVNLEEKGQHRVRVALLPITLEQRLYIDFWVRRN